MQALMSTTKSKTASNLNKYDLSFYENGFRYYAFEEDSSHDLTSKIMMYFFQLTSEKLLLKFCDAELKLNNKNEISRSKICEILLFNLLHYYNESVGDRLR